AERRTATRSPSVGPSTVSLASATRDTTRSTTSSPHWLRAASATARWPSVRGLNDPGNAPFLTCGRGTRRSTSSRSTHRRGCRAPAAPGLAWSAPDLPAGLGSFEADQPTRREADDAPVGVAGDQQAHKALGMGEVAGEHEAV